MKAWRDIMGAAGGPGAELGTTLKSTMFIAPQGEWRQNAPMPAGLSVAVALLAQVAAGQPAAAAPANPPPASSAPTYGPTPPPAAKPRPKVAAAKPSDGCRTAPPSADATEIIVCAERPQGYRLDPDVRSAKRQLRSSRPTRSMAHMKDSNCASVGPMGCTGNPGINLVGAALTAVQMATKALRGENVGSMFVTDPQTSEYELYVAAKREREAAEAEAAAKAAAKAKAAAAAAPNKQP
jgi:hypothetical protein